MANIKISDLPAASSVAAGDLFEVSQGSGTLTSRKATGTQVQSFVLDSYAGGSSIVTVGTVGTGTWQATAVAVAYGGTGATDVGTARTNLGLAIGTNVQAWDGDLDAIAALAGTSGFLKKTAANTWSLDTSTYLSTAVTSFSAGTTGLTPSTDTTGAVTLAGTLAVANGGTGGTTAATARSNLSAAASGANSDITSLAGLTTALSVAQGGTGATTAANARTNLAAAGSGAVTGSGLTMTTARVLGRTTAATGAVEELASVPVSLGGTGATDAATARTNLGLAIGTNVQAYDAELAAIAGLTSAADRLPYFTGSGTASLATFTAYARSLLDDADAATARTTLGLGTAATMTGPSGTIVGTTDTQSLSNKTLTAPVVTDYSESVVTANTTTAYTISLTSGTVQNLTLTGNCTLTFPTATAGKSFLLVLKQDAIGSRTVTWPAAVKWPGSTAPTITSTASKADLYAFTADGTNWYGRTLGQNYL